MKIYSASDKTIRWASEIEPDAFYGKGCFSNFSFHRGRMMQEALCHDPIAPHGVANPRFPSRVVYNGQEILDYLASYSDDLIPASAEIERQRKDDRREFALELERVKDSHKAKHTELMKSIGDTRSAILKLVRETLDKSIDITKGVNSSCGVYFLRSKGEIVYVGQSVSVYGRVHQHKSSKEFDEVTLLPCKPEDLNNLEGFFIRLLRPKLNGHNAITGRHGAPSSWLWGDVVELDASLVPATEENI